MTTETQERAHDLKTWPEPFAAVRTLLKPWELRRNDRDYQVGDLLRLHEWDPATEEASGEMEVRRVTWMLNGPAFGLPEGYCIMSMEPIDTRPREAELEAEMGRLRVGVRRALTYMDPMSPGHSSKKMADARRVLQVALSTIRAAKT